MSSHEQPSRPTRSDSDVEVPQSQQESTPQVSSSMLADREAAMDSVRYRFSGGKSGVAPMARIMDERRNTATAAVQRIHRKADGDAKQEAEVPQGGGSALDSKTRARMEPKLGADLSQVRVHTGNQSAAAAKGYGARAFTVGSDVHFNAGEFKPGTKEGDKLLAHELTHVVQGQKSGVQRKEEQGEAGKAGAEGKGAVSEGHEPAEKEADAVGEEVAGALHGDEKGDKKKGDKKKGGKGDKKKEGEAAGDHAAGEEHHAGDGHAHEEGEEKAGDKGKEKPAKISAKLEGTGFKLMRAKDDKADKKDSSFKSSAKTDAKATPPPSTMASKYAGGYAVYLGNWGKFQTVLKEHKIPEDQIAGLAGKKNDWFDRVCTAVEGKDRSAVNKVVDSIYAECPKDPAPESHFWSGGKAAAGQRAQDAVDAKNASKPKDQPQAKRLESTHVGALFDNVLDAKKPGTDKGEFEWAGQAKLFWDRLSKNYAAGTQGVVTVHLNIVTKYLKAGQIDRSSVFAEWEAPEIVENMKKNIVTGLQFDMKVSGEETGKTGTKVPVNGDYNFTIPASGSVSVDSIFTMLNAKVQEAVNAAKAK